MRTNRKNKILQVSDHLPDLNAAMNKWQINQLTTLRASHVERRRVAAMTTMRAATTKLKELQFFLGIAMVCSTGGG